MNSLTTSLSYNFFFNLYIQTWIRSEILLFFTYFIHYHFLVFLTSHMSILYNKLKSNFELQVLIFVLQRDIVRRNNIFVIFRFVSLLVLFFFVFIGPSKISTSSLFSYSILHALYILSVIPLFYVLFPQFLFLSWKLVTSTFTTRMFRLITPLESEFTVNSLASVPIRYK